MLKAHINKHTIVIILIVGVVIGGGIFFAFKKLILKPKVHYHGGFIVFQNNRKIDFSDIKYMYTKPCTVNGKEDEEHENPQLEKAHLHNNVGDLVHVEARGATWKDLFTNINFPIDEKITTGYIGEKIIPSFLNLPIQPNDSLVVFIGSNDPVHLKEAVTKEYITEMAKKSTTCGD